MGQEDGLVRPQIYLDYNASTPIAPEVRQAMLPYLESAYGNPSSTHWAGRPAREAVNKARLQVADLLGCVPGEIVFTSGGTEANNHALKGAFYANGAKGHFVTTTVEHPAIIEPLRFLESLGADVTVVPVDFLGHGRPFRRCGRHTIRHRPCHRDACEQRGRDHSADSGDRRHL